MSLTPVNALSFAAWHTFELTRYGTQPNEYFDMLAIAQYWNAPVTILPALSPGRVLA